MFYLADIASYKFIFHCFCDKMRPDMNNNIIRKRSLNASNHV